MQTAREAAHRRDKHRQTFRPGWTLIELLMTVAVVGLLATLLLAGVQYAREAARRSRCASQLRQIGTAMQSYHDAHGAFPPGNSRGFCFLSHMLPQLEERPLFEKIHYEVFPGKPANAAARETVVPLFLCPSDAKSAGRPVSNYCACFGSGVQKYGYNGVFRIIHGSFLTPSENQTSTYMIGSRDITDGLSNTAAVSELLVGGDGETDQLRLLWQTPIQLGAANQLDDFADTCQSIVGPPPPPNPWARGNRWLDGDQMNTGYNHVLTPNHNSCTNGGVVPTGAYTAASLHPGGVNLLYADGHLSFESERVERRVWRALGSRNGGEKLE